MDRKELSAEIVRLVCEKGKGLSIDAAVMAIRNAEALFLNNAKIVDGTLSPQDAE